MNERPAGSARVLGRGIALVVAVFVVISGAGCGRQTFDLLGLDASTPNGGAASSNAGDSSIAPAGGHGGSLGTGRGGTSGSGPGHGGSANGSSGNGNASSGNGGSNGGASGDGQGGNDEPCLPGESCVDGGVSCPPTVNFCKRCASNDDCGRDAPPYCDIADGRCVECLPNQANCKTGESCDPTFFRCAKSCASPNDCDNHRVCAMSRGVCVDCIFNSDCADVAGHATYKCAAGFCVECLGDRDCFDLSKPMCSDLKCVAKP